MPTKESGPKNARYRVFQQLRARIVSMNLPPGTPISENELATRMGVSRTPIREALLLLAEEGLVEVFPKIGTFVTRLDVAQIKEAQFLRESVEIASLRSIAFPLEAGLVDEVWANLRAQADVPRGDLATFFELDEAFHRSIMGLAGHAASWATVAAAKSHLDRARVLGIQEVSEHRIFYEQHLEVFEAIVAEDLDSAERLLRDHLRVIFSDIEAAEKVRPELFNKTGTERPELRPAYFFAEWLRYEPRADVLNNQQP